MWRTVVEKWYQGSFDTDHSTVVNVFDILTVSTLFWKPKLILNVANFSHVPNELHYLTVTLFNWDEILGSLGLLWLWYPFF